MCIERNAVQVPQNNDDCTSIAVSVMTLEKMRDAHAQVY